MFRIEVFLNEMLERVQKAELLLSNHGIQKKDSFKKYSSLK